MLGQRRTRWPNIKPALIYRLGFAGMIRRGASRTILSHLPSQDQHPYTGEDSTEARTCANPSSGSRCHICHMDLDTLPLLRAAQSAACWDPHQQKMLPERSLQQKRFVYHCPTAVCVGLIFNQCLLAVPLFPQQTPYIIQCCFNVGPTLEQHWLNVSYFLRHLRLRRHISIYLLAPILINIEITFNERHRVISFGQYLYASTSLSELDRERRPLSLVPPWIIIPSYFHVSTQLGDLANTNWLAWP